MSTELESFYVAEQDLVATLLSDYDSALEIYGQHVVGLLSHHVPSEIKEALGCAADFAISKGWLQTPVAPTEGHLDRFLKHYTAYRNAMISFYLEKEPNTPIEIILEKLPPLESALQRIDLTLKHDIAMLPGFIKSVDKIPLSWLKGDLGLNLSSLDAILGGGLERSTYTLITGFTNSGKSTFMRAMAYNLAVQGYNVVYATLEDTVPKTWAAFRKLDTLMAETTLINHLYTNIDNPDRWQGPLQDGSKLTVIQDTSVNSLDTIKRLAKGADFLFIDQLSHIGQPERKNDTINYRYTSISKQLQKLAKTQGIAVILSAQSRDAQNLDKVMHATDVSKDADLHLSIEIGKPQARGNTTTVKLCKWKYPLKAGQATSAVLYFDNMTGFYSTPHGKLSHSEVSYHVHNLRTKLPKGPLNG